MSLSHFKRVARGVGLAILAMTEFPPPAAEREELLDGQVTKCLSVDFFPPLCFLSVRLKAKLAERFHTIPSVFNTQSKATDVKRERERELVSHIFAKPLASEMPHT